MNEPYVGQKSPFRSPSQMFPNNLRNMPICGLTFGDYVSYFFNFLVWRHTYCHGDSSMNRWSSKNRTIPIILGFHHKLLKNRLEAFHRPHQKITAISVIYLCARWLLSTLFSCSIMFTWKWFHSCLLLLTSFPGYFVSLFNLIAVGRSIITAHGPVWSVKKCVCHVFKSFHSKFNTRFLLHIF